MHLMGWPQNVIFGSEVSKTDVGGLVGEGLHLASIGSILYSVFMIGSAPWWSQEGLATGTSGVRLRAPPIPDLQEPKPKRHKRRVGNVQV